MMPFSPRGRLGSLLGLERFALANRSTYEATARPGQVRYSGLSEVSFGYILSSSQLPGIYGLVVGDYSQTLPGASNVRGRRMLS